ncbi:CMP-N-acetylneuraminate-beta-galactosamide-alpha-2,3-sialyltransferase 4-like [Pristis pectinata]|uniref:CMP-N-acetylneuraminate-beta-galactosamide- alpha-2,3-sialyltransferase 4-like n=1 Tax=Pristis pectinata TaxID=685728 RepID=UPI00223CDF40|nr:CMP-N-acetylneuraminate-beta-galactosamide-alpha-2,3-sialyltransferase 4-like [Pristis pectinata]
MQCELCQDHFALGFITVLVQIWTKELMSRDRLVCKQCVVVGNGNALRNSLLGEVINKYDIVIRLNNAPVRGYEQHVGSKTTLRFFYPESATEDLSGENDPDMLFVLVPFKTADLLWLKALVYNETSVMKGFWKNPPLIKKFDISKVRILSPFYLRQLVMKLLQQPDKESHPTTGLLAVTVALNYCDVVHLAGFGYPHNQKNGLIHYFDNQQMTSMAVLSNDNTMTLKAITQKDTGK